LAYSVEFLLKFRNLISHLQQHLANYCKLLHPATLVRRPDQPEQYLVRPALTILTYFRSYFLEQKFHRTISSDIHPCGDWQLLSRSRSRTTVQ